MSIEDGQWQPAPTPYARALVGLPKVHARIQEFVAGTSPPIKTTGR